MLRRSGPETLRDNHQLRFLPGANQTVGILVMREVGAARPPQHADVREMPIHTVMLIETAGVFQRLNDTRHRDFIHRVGTAFEAPLHRSQYRCTTCRVPAVGKMVRQPKATAGRANLTEHGGQRDDHPVFLLAILLTLHPPAGHQHGGILVKYCRKFAYFRCRNTTNFSSPFCRFRYPIGFTQ